MMIVNKGVIEDPINKHDLYDSGTNTYFLPHHPILNINQDNSSCRIVFESSTKYRDNTSLTDVIFRGPKLTKYLIYSAADSAFIQWLQGCDGNVLAVVHC